MHRASRLAVVVVIAGCGRIGFQPLDGDAAKDVAGDASPRDPVAGISGTRLRAERWVAPDGASQFAGWYDSQLASKCVSGYDSAGTLRCFPNEADIGYAFADASCTVPLAGVTSDCAAPTVGYQFVAPHYEAYALGAVHAGPVYTMAAGCTQLMTSGTFLDVGARLPDAQLVSAMVTPVDAGDSMAFVDEVWDDGARNRVVGAGQYLGSDCDLEHTGATEHCVAPSSVGIAMSPASYYDAACTIPAYQDPGVAAFHIIDQTQPCWDDVERIAGTQHPNTTVLYFKAATGACMSYAIASATVIELVDPAASRPALTFASAPGTTRLRPAGFATSTGGLFVDEMFDSQLGLPCQLAETDATTAVCVPFGSAEPFMVSLDYACGSAVQNVEAVCGGTMVATFSGTSCNGPIVSLQAYTPSVPATVASENVPGIGCVTFDLSRAQLFGRTMTAVDTTQLEQLTRVRD